MEITFAEEDWQSILTSNYEDNIGGQIPYLLASIMIDGEGLDSVGVRYKGFTSYIKGINKNSLKLDFNVFVSGQEFQGLRKINLNNGFADPSMLRDPFSYQMLRNFGLEAPRTSYSEVYINGILWGVYQNIEQIDQSFLKQNFEFYDGNLFKNIDFSQLEWEGDDPVSYQPPFELKTNEEENDWQGFIDFLHIINNTSDEDFSNEIGQIFNVEKFLKILAADVALNNWDSYVFHGRNFYLYEDDEKEQFQWIPWDYNLALGAGGFSVLGSECKLNVDFVGHTNGTNRVEFYDLSNVKTDASYSWDFGDGTSSSEIKPIHEYIESGSYEVCLQIMLNDSCIDSRCREIETTFDPMECSSVSSGTFPNEVDFLFQRILASRASCCDFWDSLCEDRYIDLQDDQDGINFITLDIDQTQSSGILIKRLLKMEDFSKLYYQSMCNLLNRTLVLDPIFNQIDQNKLLIEDAVNHDENYLYTKSQFELGYSDEDTPGSLKYYIKDRIEELRTNLDTLFTCPDSIVNLNALDVAINELVASSDELSLISDADGEFDDWIELYNNTDSKIDLSGFFLSDNKLDKTKWSFPEGSEIMSNGYMILWADDDVEQDGLHTNFKLSKEGEELLLYAPQGEFVDSVSFGEQTLNLSLARNPNGVGEFVLQEPTFGISNEESSFTDRILISDLRISPNPSSSSVSLLDIDLNNLIIDIDIFTSSGIKVRELTKHNSSSEIDVSDLSPGMYFLKVHLKSKMLMIGKFVVE